jgi:PAS domain S-box-containing protein
MSAAPVLIVEDDAATAELERRALMRSGCSVRTVNRISDAIALLRSDSIGVVLLDYNLPDGDPWSVVDEARARVPRVPVIVVTAMGNERVAAEALQHGVAEYVQKTAAFWNQLPDVVRRVSATAQADERVRRSDALFCLIAASATDLVATADLSGVIQEVSAACRSMLGFEPEELIGQPAVNYVHPDDRERLQAAFASQTHLRITYRQRKRDGGYLWVETNANVVRDPVTGKAREIVAIVRDVHERRRAEEKFRALIEGAPEASVIVDRDQRVVLVNARAEGLFGYPRAALEGKPFDMLLAEPERCPSLVSQREGAPVLELNARRNDGSVFLAEISLNRLETEGELLVSTTIQDISDRKTLQDQRMLLRLGEQLQRFDEVQPMVQYVVDELGHYFDCTRAAFVENSEVDGTFMIHAEYRREGAPFVGSHPMSMYAPKLREELEHGAVAVVADAAIDPRTAAVYERVYAPLQLRSLAVMPLSREHQFIGCIYVGSQELRYWTTRELQMLQALGERAWLWLEHVRMLHALRASERKYRHFIETTREGVWEIDREGKTCFVNPRMAELLGYEPVAMMGQPLTAFMDREGLEATPSHVERRKAGVSEAHDFKFIRKDGKELWARLEADPLRDEHGDYVGALAMVADITERRQAERDQAFLLELAELISVTDDPGVVLDHAGRRLGEHLGIDRVQFIDFEEELKYVRVRSEWHAPGLDALEGRFEMSTFGGILPEFFRGRIIALDDVATDPRSAEGSAAFAAVRFGAMIAVPMYSDQRLSAAMLITSIVKRNWTGRDVELVRATVERVTLGVQRLQGIAALRDMSRELERRVEERTSELKDMLSEKEVLLKEIHHRVKNNLQVISSMLNLQAMHIEDATVQSILNESRMRVQSIALVHEKLYESQDLSRVDFANYLHTLVNTTMQAQGGSERNIATRIEAQTLRLPVGAAIPCGLIANELVTNSLKHAFRARDHGTIFVRLSCKDGDWVTLEVGDDGVGLPKDLDLRQLTSLGLDLVYTFAEQLGADVAVESVNGTLFRFGFSIRARGARRAEVD